MMTWSEFSDWFAAAEIPLSVSLLITVLTSVLLCLLCCCAYKLSVTAYKREQYARIEGEIEIKQKEKKEHTITIHKTKSFLELFRNGNIESCILYSSQSEFIEYFPIMYVCMFMLCEYVRMF